MIKMNLRSFASSLFGRRQVTASAPQGDQALFSFRHVRNALIRGCMPEAGTKVFLNLSGAENERISVLGNDLSAVKTVASVDGGASLTCVSEIGNRK